MTILLLITTILLALSGLANMYQARSAKKNGHAWHDFSRAAIKKLEAERDEARQFCDDFERELDELEAERDELQDQHDDQERELLEWQEVADRLEAERDEWRTKAEELQTKVVEWRTDDDHTLSQMANRLDHANLKSRAQVEALRVAQHDLNIAINEREEFRSEIGELKNLLEAKRAELERARNMYENLQQWSQGQSKYCSELEAERDDALNEAAEFRADLNSEHDAHGETIARLTKANEKIEEQREAKKRLRRMYYRKDSVIKELEWILYLDAGYGSEAHAMADIAAALNTADPKSFANDYGDHPNRIEVQIGTYGRLIVYKSSPHHAYCQHVNGPILRIPASQMTPALRKAQALAKRAIKGLEVMHAE